MSPETERHDHAPTDAEHAEPRAATGEATGDRPLPVRAPEHGERAEPAPEPGTVPPVTASPHAHRFRIATAMLAGIAIGALAVAIAVIIGGGGSSSNDQPWSSWKPTQSGLAGAREIADHLAPLYRIDGVNQLAIVTVSSLSAPTSPATSSTSSANSGSGGLQVAVRSDPTSSQVSLINGRTIAFNLCGIGSSNCSIGVGKPSADRLLLLKREALELALYTFRYIGGVQNVVAVLPPSHTVPSTTSRLSAKPPTTSAPSRTSGTSIDYALLFLHDELKPWLQQPLTDTLPEQFPPIVAQLPTWKQTTEAALVSQITERGLFSEHTTTTQDGTNLIVLDALPPQ